MSANPYAPPLGSSAQLVPELSDAASIRRQYLNHEASVKSIGILYYLGSGVWLILSGMSIYGALTSEVAPPQERAVMAGLGFFYLVMGALQGATGFGLRRLHRWAKPIAIVLSILGLLAFPLGTIINGYILYLLVSQKGSIVFSDAYQRVIADTPDIKYKTSFLVLVLVAVLVTIGIVALVAVVTTATI